MSSGGRGSYSIHIDLDANQAISAVSQLKTQLGSLTPSFQGVTGGANQAAMSFERYNAAAQKTVGTSSALGSGLGRVAAPLGQLNSQINSTAATLPRLSSAQQQAAQSANQMGQAIQGQTQKITAMASRLGGVAFMFTGLTAAMGEAQGMQGLLTDTQDKLTSAQQKAAQAIQKYGKDSFQATRALEGVEKQERALAFQTRITTLSIQDQFFFIGALASMAAGPISQGIGKMREAMKAAALEGKSFSAVLGTSFAGAGARMTGVINAITGGLNALSPSFMRVGQAANLAATNTARNTTVLGTYTVATGAATAGTATFGAALTRLALHPVMLAIMALGAAYLVLQQNLFGVTDRLREFGVSLGQAVPVLRPFLDLLDAVGAQLGITGDAAVDAGDRFRDAMSGFQDLGGLWHDTLAEMQRSSDEWTSTLGDNLVRLSDGIAQQRSEIQRQLDDTTNTFNLFVEQLRNQDYSGAFDTLIGAVSALPDIIWNALKSGAARLNEIGILIADSIGPGLESIGQWIHDALINAGGLVTEGAKRVATFFFDGFKAQLAMINSQIIIPIVNAFNGIAGQVQNIGEQVYSALGLEIVHDRVVELVNSVVAELSKIPEQLGTAIPKTPLAGELPTRFVPAGVTPGAVPREQLPTFGSKTVSEMRRGLIEESTTQAFPFQRQKITVPPEVPFGTKPLPPKPERDVRLLGTTPKFGRAPVMTPEIGRQIDTQRRLAEVQKAVTMEMQAQEQAGIDATRMYNDLTNNGMNPALIKGKDLQLTNELMATEFKLDAMALGILTEAQKESNRVLDEGGTAKQADAAATKVLTDNKIKAAVAEETVISKLKDSNAELAKTYNQTAQAIQEESFMKEMSKQGTLEAQNAIVSYGAELLKNTQFNKEWGAAIDSNTFKEAAFRTGVQKQVAELNNQKVAVAENVGVLAEYTRQVESGEAGQVAFARGVQTQQKSLLDSKVALAETAGQLQEYASQLASGEQQTVAFAQGQQAVQQSFLDMIRNVSELQGSISEYDRLLADGTAQTIAFAQGMAQGQLAAREFQVEIAGANGEYQGFREGLIATNPELQRFGDLSSFTNEQIAAMAAAIGGGREAIHALVEGLREAASGFTEFLGSVDIKELDDEFEEAVEDIRGGIEDMIDVAEQEGVKVPEALENAMDFEATKQKVGQQLEELWPMITGILEAGANTLDPNIMSSAVDVAIANVRHVLEEGDLPAATQQVVQGIITEMENLKNIKDPVELQQALANIGIKISALADNKDGLEETTTALTGLANVPADSLASLAERIAGVAESVETLIQKQPQLARFKEDLQGLALNAPATFKGISEMPTAGEAAQKLAPGGQPVTPFPTAAPDVSAIEPQIARIQQMLSLLGPAAQQAVGQMSAAFGTLDLTALTEKLRLGLEPLTLLGPATTQAVAQMSAAFSALDLSGLTEKLRVGLEPLTLLGPATQQAVAQMSAAFASIDLSGFLAALQPIHEVLALLGPATQQAVAQMVAAFNAGTNTMITAMQGVQNMVTQTAARFPEIGTAAQTAAGTVNTATNTMITALQGVQNMATQTAQSFAQIGDAANAAAQVVNSATNTMITALQGVISMADQVADSIAGIGAAAQAAESDVQALSTAISNIPDGDAVIRVTYDVAPAPSGITAAGVGLGFSRSGTVTYTAGGGSGGGGGGGGGGGPNLGGGGGGGGPGEPTLQFAGGLGRPAFDHKSEEFNKLGILAPLLIDHPMRMMVGENGPELVSVTPVGSSRTYKRSGEMSPFISKQTRKPIATYQGGLGEFHTMGDTPTGGGFGGTINIGQGVVQFRDSGPIQVNVMQGTGGAGGGIGTGIPTTGGGFPTGGFGAGGPQQFNVPGGQVSVSGNAVACVNGQCFGNMAGFGPALGQQQKPFEPVRDEQGMIKAIETLKEWFKYLGLPLGGIGGAGLTIEDIQKNYNPFRPTFEGGMFGGGFGGGGAMASAGRGGAAATAGGGGAMAMAGGAFAFAGKGGMGSGGGMQGGGSNFMGVPIWRNTDPSTWQVAPGQIPGGAVVYFIVDSSGFIVAPVSFKTEEDAQKFIQFYSIAKQQPQQFPQFTGGGGTGFGNTVIQGNPALLNTPFFNNFFGGNNPFTQGGGGMGGLPTGGYGQPGGFGGLPTGGGGGLPTGGGGAGGGCSICGAASSLQGAAGDISNMFGGMAGNGQAMAMGNAVACVNGQCFGNMQGFGAPTGAPGMGGQGNTFQGPLPPGMTPEQFVQQFMSGQFGGQGGIPGQINMTGGNINFDQNQGEMELQTSTGAIAIAGPGGAFATAGRATAGVGLFGAPTSDEAQLRQLQEMNQNLNNLNGQLGEQNTEFTQFQQQQQDFLIGPNGLVNQFQQFPQQMQTAFGTGMGQIFNAPGFTGFGQGFQQIPGGGAVGSGQAAGNPMGFLNSMLGGFGLPNPFGGVGGTPVTGGGGTAPGGSFGGAGCDVCGAIRSIGGSVGGGGGTGGGGGGGAPAGPGTGGYGGGGAGEPTFQGGGGGGGGNLPPQGGPGTTPPAPGQTTPGCRFHCRPMDSDPDRYRIDDAEGNESNGGVYYDTALACNQRLQELCPTSLSPGNNMTPAPQQPYQPFQPGTPAQPPGGGFGQPGGSMQTGGGRAVAIAGGGMLGGPQAPGMGGGFMGPIGPPPVPPRIVQEAGIPSQHPSVNQDPTSWQIVESAGLVGTYDIIDNNGDIVQLGFRTIRDAEIYLNYFISYYNWVKGGSTGIPGPTPVPGSGGGGFGGGGIPNPGGGGGGTLPGGGYTPVPPGTPPGPVPPGGACWPCPPGMICPAVCYPRDGPPPPWYNGLPGYGGGAPVPPVGGGGGVGGGVPGAGFGGGGVSVSAGNAQASAGMGGAFAQAGGAMASAGGFLGGRPPGTTVPKPGGPTQEPVVPFVPIPRPQGPFRHGQDNQEAIYDNSGIKIGTKTSSDETVTMEDIEEGGGGEGGGGGKGKGRFRERLRRHIAAAFAGRQGDQELHDRIVSAIETAFGNIMLNMTLNNTIDGNMLNRSMGKYQLKKVSVFT